MIQSGLYARLAERGLLCRHEETDHPPFDAGNSLRVIEPEPVPFVSYPYEWCFGELKDAALVTLAIQRQALQFGMSLKDASAYNIQFVGSKPVLIDSLSFEMYDEGKPWIAYRQFCQHFLAPLALMSRRDIRLGQLLRVHIDGLPLELASRLLPRRTWLDAGLLIHLHLHAQAQSRLTGRRLPSRGRMSREAMDELILSLQRTIQRLTWRPHGTPWADYELRKSYSGAAAEDKRGLVAEWVSRIRPSTIWDLGANAGVYSRIALEAGARMVVAFDLDPAAVERNYLQTRATHGERLLPLVLDLTNPSPALGWAHRERESFIARGPADLILALALVHHLAIANNLPLEMIGALLASVGRWHIIEFVPKSDSRVQQLLVSRQDIFPEYSPDGFEAALRKRFTVHARVQLTESDRQLYLLESLAAA